MAFMKSFPFQVPLEQDFQVATVYPDDRSDLARTGSDFGVIWVTRQELHAGGQADRRTGGI